MGELVARLPGIVQGWLVLTRLGPGTTGPEFGELTAGAGPVLQSCLVVTASGDSLGYGVVRYRDRQAGALARQLLRARGQEADWLDSSLVRYSQLHSRALRVDNLPPGFR